MDVKMSTINKEIGVAYSFLIIYEANDVIEL